MDLVILGSSGTYPRPGGACNSYLVRSENSRLLIDLGPGSLSQLFKWQDPAHIDGFFISHLHPDHFLDIYPLRYYLQFSADQGAIPIDVYAPPGARDKIAPLFSDKNIAGFDRVFAWHDLKEGLGLKIGGFRVTPFEVPHLPPTFALAVDGPAESGRLFYTSDTAYDPMLADLARDADLFLCEASLLSKDAGSAAHLTGAQAGEIAREANAAHLVLTHLWPHTDAKEILAEAVSEFNGKVDLADDGKVFEVTG